VVKTAVKRASDRGQSLHERRQLRYERTSRKAVADFLSTATGGQLVIGESGYLILPSLFDSADRRSREPRLPGCVSPDALPQCHALATGLCRLDPGPGNIPRATSHHFP
jgi:hypothetical protein